MTTRMKVLVLALVAGLVGVGLFARHAGHPNAAPAPTAISVNQAQTPALPGTSDTTGDPAAPTAAAKPDPCSAITTTAQVIDPTALGSGDPDDGFDQPTADDNTPKPANPVTGSCENGRIKMRVGNPQEFGNRIGDVVPVRIMILTDDGVLIDFSSLKQRTLGFQGSDFVLARDNPVTVKMMKKDHQVLYVIDLNVQTFVNKDPGVVFNLDLRYATGLAGDSKTPDWKVLTTPDFFVTRSNTVDNGDSALEGSLDAVASPAPWPMWPLLTVGFFLIFLWPGVVVVRYLNRLRPGRKIPANETAWKKFDKALNDANEFGWDVRHFKQIASALRVYLGVAPHTRLEVLDRLSGHPQLETIKSALTKCDRVLYEHETLSAEETRELVREIKTLVPKPN